jgi:hypothetical protein
MHGGSRANPVLERTLVTASRASHPGAKDYLFSSYTMQQNVRLRVIREKVRSDAGRRNLTPTADDLPAELNQ